MAFPALTAVGVDLVPPLEGRVEVGLNPFLQELDLRVLESINQPESSFPQFNVSTTGGFLSVRGNDALTTMRIDALTKLGVLQLEANPNLGSGATLDLTPIEALLFVQVVQSDFIGVRHDTVTQLVSLDISGNSSLGEIRFDAVATVDSIFRIDANQSLSDLRFQQLRTLTAANYEVTNNPFLCQSSEVDSVFLSLTFYGGRDPPAPNGIGNFDQC